MLQDETTTASYLRSRVVAIYTVPCTGLLLLAHGVLTCPLPLLLPVELRAGEPVMLRPAALLTVVTHVLELYEHLCAYRGLAQHGVGAAPALSSNRRGSGCYV